MERIDTITARRRANERRAMLLACVLCFTGNTVHSEEPKKIAAVVTVYHRTSHADAIASRLFQTYTLDGKGEVPKLALASLYVDQFSNNDISRKLAEQYKFPIYDKIAGASRSARASSPSTAFC